jgi:hypothetical protein
MTESSSTETATTATTAVVYVGNGRVTHHAAADERGPLYTYCGAEGRGMRVSRLVKADAGNVVTCQNCTGDKTAPALPAAAPATCPTHKQAAYAPKTVKAGTYVGYPCGCKVWTA